MSECHQYNNYAFMVHKLKSAMALDFAAPNYDAECENGLARQGEVKQTASLFPAGLAYLNAPRIDTDCCGGDGGGGSGGNSATGFDNGDLGDFTLSGSALRPWTADAAAACAGSAYGARAGHSRGVDSESFISIQVPDGATQASYLYSNPSALDRGDDFHVIVNGQVMASYETGSGANCDTGMVSVQAGDTLQLRCRSGGNGETCAVDEVVFN